VRAQVRTDRLSPAGEETAAHSTLTWISGVKKRDRCLRGGGDLDAIVVGGIDLYWRRRWSSRPFRVLAVGTGWGVPRPSFDV
jgi:hypothetical protein